MTKQDISLSSLFFTFFKLGAMSFGGGYAMLPMIERELIEKRNWIDNKQLLDFYAIAQATPGVIAVNVATLIGFQKRRFKGSLAATFGIVTPSLIIITTIASFLGLYMEAQIVGRIFASLKICVAALVIHAIIPFFKRGIINIFTGILFALSFSAFYFLKISPALIVIFCALSYILYESLRGKLK